MNKLQKLSVIILFGLLVFNTSPAEAQLKFDFGNAVGSGQELVGRIQGKISDIQRYIQNQVTMLTRVAGEAKGLLADAKSGLVAAQESVNGVTSAVDQAKETASNAVNSATNAVNQAKETASNTAGAALAKAQELKKLQMDASVAQEAYKQALMDIDDSKSAETEKYEENNAKLEKMIAQTNDESEKATYQQMIDGNNAKIKEISDKYEQQKEQKKAETEVLLKSINETLDKLKAEVAELNPVNKESAKKAVSGLFSGDSSNEVAGEMNAVIQDNFYAKGEEMSSTRNGQIFNYRRETAINDSADVFAKAVDVLKEDDTLPDYIEELKKGGEMAETEQGILQMDISVKIEQMRQLLKLARLWAAELKMETAKDMVNMNTHLNNYDKDVLVFNLDDYKYDKKKKR